MKYIVLLVLWGIFNISLFLILIRNIKRYNNVVCKNTQMYRKLSSLLGLFSISQLFFIQIMVFMFFLLLKKYHNFEIFILFYIIVYCILSIGLSIFFLKSSPIENKKESENS